MNTDPLLRGLNPFSLVRVMIGTLKSFSQIYVIYLCIQFQIPKRSIESKRPSNTTSVDGRLHPMASDSNHARNDLQFQLNRADCDISLAWVHAKDQNFWRSSTLVSAYAAASRRWPQDMFRQVFALRHIGDLKMHLCSLVVRWLFAGQPISTRRPILICGLLFPV